MPDRLISDHAEDVGGVIVEPGDTIPKTADDDVVERLEAEGKIGAPGDGEPEQTTRKKG